MSKRDAKPTEDVSRRSQKRESGTDGADDGLARRLLMPDADADQEPDAAQAAGQAAAAQEVVALAAIAASNDAEQKQMQQRVKMVRVKKGGGYVKLPAGYHQMAATDEDFTPTADFPRRKFYLDYGGRQHDTSVPPTVVCRWAPCTNRMLFHWSLDCPAVSKHVILKCHLQLEPHGRHSGSGAPLLRHLLSRLPRRALSPLPLATSSRSPLPLERGATSSSFKSRSRTATNTWESQASRSTSTTTTTEGSEPQPQPRPVTGVSALS